MFELQDYLSSEGVDPYARWLTELADRQAKARVLVRVQRMAAGAFGDCKPLRDGVWELRRLGTGLPCVLRASWQAPDSAARWWRQAQTDCGY